MARRTCCGVSRGVLKMPLTKLQLHYSQLMMLFKWGKAEG